MSKRIFFGFFFVMLYLFNTPTYSDTGKNSVLSSNQQSREDAVVLAVHQAIRDNKLTTLRDHCLAYDYDDVSDMEFYFVDVREDKRYAICGGDPDVSVHLFRFKVSRNDYTLFTDAGSVDGTFHAIDK
ncbi:hypothetical protein PMPD1_0730 [Paramixta manurensis]|uniref:Uncharacterized protein n=1 Tax=Paramixta manurensis TaxID=2740817 RepID=A0A6M8UFY4_9GAMM|nr:hypothetical protein PMPD1_0730 [Erwiniaceae bacterium PD-1]